MTWKSFTFGFLVAVLSACGPTIETHDQSSGGGFIPPANSTCSTAAVEKRFIVKWIDGQISVLDGISRQELDEYLLLFGDEIEFAEHDYVVRAEPIVEAMNLNSDPEDWGQLDSRADFAWTNGIYGEGIMIAVVDSGVDPSHPQIKDQLFVNPFEVIDGVDNDNNGYADDISGWNYINSSGQMGGDTFHGTHVSGIALADHGKGSVKGMAPKATLLPLKFIESSSGFITNAIAAIEYAARMAKRVNMPLIVNASWGGGDCSAALRAKMLEHEDRKVLFTVAAGNDGRDLSRFPVYPANFGLKNQITVGAHSLRNVMAAFSNFGAKVDLVAPGFDIFSLAPGGHYARAHGTSMAAPFVAGAAALLWSLNPNLSGQQIKAVIEESVEVGGFDVKLQGKLNIQRAIQLLN